ncbi:MAG TPA: alpha/beta hydrolase [Pseudonocardia sp.]|jgi:pimeloyl-ACP methyl ester carboxylesterase|uniref:alpha/beta fold hydrolase n=1 Tax=Pseudonocardia sp. TaxID=60912 RepID=UPI002B4B1AF0|nr:alpha/beta hydrolase [Pseudonocardia sp.]HLU58160.1 alpha/beta hydrolase [Pseudonocardia sp.]
MPHFTAADGTRLAYEDYDPTGSGEPIVFDASWVLDADMWEYQIPFFAERGYRCIAFDRRGHGRSDRPSTGYDVDTTADDLAALLEHLDLTGVTLVGHSFGGAEVVRYLARHGEDRVARVGLVAAVVPILVQTEDNPEGLPEAVLEATIAQLRTDRPRWFARQAQVWYATHLGNDVSEALIDWTLRKCLSASPWAATQLMRSMFHADHRAALRAITVPTLVVHGAADTSAPVELTGRRTAQLVPGCRYVEYPTAGHGLFVTHAEGLNAELLELLKS